MPPLEVLPVAVRTAIQSFPNGSAGGPDSLRPQHIKDLLLGAPDDSPLLSAITDLINLLLAGKVPASVQGALFGANLLAITKKTGGIRPIAVGYVWRRLAAKVACRHVKEAAIALLAPRQLGFGIPGGAEAAVRSARVYMENMSSEKLLVNIDFRNAFNTFRRDFVLEAVDKYFPQLLSFASSTMDFTSDLQFGDFVPRSAEGVQQGDPLGPLYFCLVCKELLESLKSELVLGYLDDITLGDDAAVCLEDFIRLEAASAKLGLTMNRSNCEVIGHNDDSRALFSASGVCLPETDKFTAILLGSPLSAGRHLDEILVAKKQELQRLVHRLRLMPSHDSLFLLRNVLTAPRLIYLLRSAPCTDSPVLPLYDEVIRDSLSTTLNVEIVGDRWHQASLPVRWGGLGVRSVVMLAPSAYLASAASTTELTVSLLPARLRDTVDSGIVPATSAWLRMAYPPTNTVTNSDLSGATLLGRPMLQGTGRHTTRLYSGSCRPRSSVGFPFTRLW